MNRLTLYRFDDAFDRHVLVRDSRAMITLLSSSEMREIGDARSLLGALADARQHDARLRRALLDVRSEIERRVDDS